MIPKKTLEGGSTFVVKGGDNKGSGYSIVGNLLSKNKRKYGGESKRTCKWG